MIRVAIDMAMMRPGVGGTGSGIWTYSSSLLAGLSESNPVDIEVFCLIQRDLIEIMPNHSNIRFIAIPRIGKNVFFRLLWNHIALPVLCAYRHIDVLHKTATETPFFLTCGRVTTIHDFYYNFLFESGITGRISRRVRCQKIYFEAIQGNAFKKSDALITGSETIKREAVRRYPLSKAKIEVVYHGVPLAPNYSPVDKEENADTTFAFLYLAKFMPYKGQHMALKALKKLGQTRPDLKKIVQVSFRGFDNDSDYFDSVSSEASVLTKAGYRVAMLPYDPGKDIEELYNNSDALLFLSAYEGFGLPIIEAQQMGLPVICSDIPVLREIGGDGALYVDRDDINAVTDAMINVVRDKELRLRLISKGYENARRFRWYDAARKTLDIYRRAYSCATVQE